ncbi:Cell division FtsK/SpoIIIE [Alloactinosynnema sp. L-07]|uniref:LPXTG cell wall anchor domain-containing protein n=1 Tax=Alloactinosynnema sp. L-07 TaxID=1653480 RepID=UPI00065F00DF|nr:LPXTG cell wall anchor domain-containing protein [Alloactinosynnema sp. L-07]CRK54982.1 Cell division FtsK/SpoIIIE [Alloactinosynnema sp. L-07]
MYLRLAALATATTALLVCGPPAHAQPAAIESLSSTVTGWNTNPSRDLTIAVRVGPDVRTFTAPVTKTSARVAGVLFVDADGDNAPDPGEELANTVVHAVNTKVVSDAHNTTTDASGRFDFGNLGTVAYQVMPTRWPDGVTAPYMETNPDQAANANLHLMGVRAAPPAVAAQPGFDIAVSIAPITTTPPPSTTTPPPPTTTSPNPRHDTSRLPNTGADVDWLMIIGTTAVALGAVLIALTRRRRT